MYNLAVVWTQNYPQIGIVYGRAVTASDFTLALAAIFMSKRVVITFSLFPLAMFCYIVIGNG